MINAQRQTAPHAFAGNAPRRAVTAPAVQPQRQAAEPAKAQPVRSEMFGNMLLLVTAALIAILIGLGYLNGFAQMRNEMKRGEMLTRQLRSQREIARQLQVKFSTASTPTAIEAQAIKHNMIRAGEKDTLTVK